MLFELRQLIRELTFLAAFLAVFEPQEIQRDAAFLQFLVNVLVIRHFVFRICALTRKQQLRQFSVGQVFRQRIADTFFFGNIQYLNDRRSRTADALRYLGFVEPEVLQPQDLAVIGHIHDLLMMYSRSRVSQHFTAFVLTVQSLRWDCSVSSDEGVQFSASQLFNSCGRGVQFAATYSISLKIVPASYLKQSTISWTPRIKPSLKFSAPVQAEISSLVSINQIKSVGVVSSLSKVHIFNDRYDAICYVEKHGLQKISTIRKFGKKECYPHRYDVNNVLFFVSVI